MTQLPNVITILRVAGSFILLFFNVTDVVFLCLYCFCGFSDIIDGFLARKFKCASKTGALLDSLADICFVGCCAWKLLPLLNLPQWLWLWAGIIVMIKSVLPPTTEPWGQRTCYVADPDGNLIEIGSFIDN